MRKLQAGSRFWKLSAMVLLLVVAFMRRDAEARVYCETSSRNTSTLTAKGSTCDNAKNNLAQNTQAEAGNTCYDVGFDFVCSNSTVVYTTACTWNATLGKYEISGYRTFRCGVNLEP